MSPRVFAETAADYWSRNLRVVPISPGTKKPAINGWTGLLAEIPNDGKKKELLEKYADHGIGLLLGSEVVAGRHLIALDVDEDRFVRTIWGILDTQAGAGAAVRSGKIGKRGTTLFVTAPADEKIKSGVLKGYTGFANVDVLSAGKMTVMPPTVHPDTREPYRVDGTALLDADFDHLPILTRRVREVIRTAIASQHVEQLVAGSSTHEAGVIWTAQMVSAGATDEELTAAFRGLLPEAYRGNSLEELPEWIASARAKEFGAPGRTGRNGTQAEAVVKTALASGLELFTDGEGGAFATFSSEGERVTTRTGSSAFSLRLRQITHRDLGRPVSGGTLADAIATLESIALFEGETHPVFNRVAGNLDLIEVDLGDKSGRAVQITSETWTVSDQPRHRFIRGTGTLALPEPRRGGNLRKLQDLLGLDEDNYVLVVAFLLSVIRPTGPYPILLIEGEQGSGKSFLAETIKMIVDPNRAPKLRLPDNDRDLMIHAKEMHILGYDNTSGMKGDISDALCSLATGGGIAVRRLYSDGDLNVMSFTRPVLINGISGYVNRPDLMERAFPIRLSPMKTGARRSEDELRPAFADMLPDLLGALFEAVSIAMRTYPDTQPPQEVRMIDAARWVVAGETGLAVSTGAMLKTIVEAQTRFMVERVNDDALMIRLREVVLYGPFEGYIGDLFAKVRGDDRPDPALPRSPSHLSRAMVRLRPAAALAGLHIEEGRKDRKGRSIRIWLDDQIELPPHLRKL